MADKADVEQAEDESKGQEQKGARDIQGGLPYTNSPGVLKKVLEGIVTAERPEKFSADFMETVLKASGGSARVVPPILKKMGFLTSDGSPTDVYSRFKSDSGRSAAAFEGLKKAFAEMFRRKEFVHRASKDEIRDVIVEITGLNRNDPVVRSMLGTFSAINDFIDVAKLSQSDGSEAKVEDIKRVHHEDGAERAASKKNGLSLVYNINIVLPETTNIQVFNSIFRSLKENLLGDVE